MSEENKTKIGQDYNNFRFHSEKCNIFTPKALTSFHHTRGTIIGVYYICINISSYHMIKQKKVENKKKVQRMCCKSPNYNRTERYNKSTGKKGPLTFTIRYYIIDIFTRIFCFLVEFRTKLAQKMKSQNSFRFLNIHFATFTLRATIAWQLIFESMSKHRTVFKLLLAYLSL